MSSTSLHQTDHSDGRLGKPRALVITLLFTLAAAFNAAPANAEDVWVFAAASLTDTLGEIGEVYEKNSNNKIKFSFASSSTLARQIEQGAPAEICVSANVKWMDYLQERDEILTDTRKALLANQLTLVASKASEFDEVDIRAGFPLADMLGNGKLAMGNPGHVPAGIYGKQALKSLGVWQSVEDQVARAADVRAALALVALGEAPLGIVYKTDALAADNVKIVGIFPADSHTDIIYPAALTQAVNEDNKAARDFYRFMGSEKADSIFEKYGFKVLDKKHSLTMAD